ncbi:hypothetical protein P7K49_009036, partial [Saguinus oedipus]
TFGNSPQLRRANGRKRDVTSVSPNPAGSEWPDSESPSSAAQASLNPSPANPQRLLIHPRGAPGAGQKGRTRALQAAPHFIQFRLWEQHLTLSRAPQFRLWERNLASSRAPQFHLIPYQAFAKYVTFIKSLGKRRNSI